MQPKMEWPAIKPKFELKVNYLKENDLFAVQKFFTSSESKAFIKAAESLGFVHQQGLKIDAYIDNSRISMDDPNLANIIWESGFNKLFKDIKIGGKVAVGLNPNIRFYRYNVGQSFGRHYDALVDLGDGKNTLYTLLIYLTGIPQSKGEESDGDALVGGETVFYDSQDNVAAEVAPEVGMALLHMHGDPENMWHEAREVTKGAKYVLRSDVVFA